MSPFIFHDGTVVVTVRDGVGRDAVLAHLAQHLDC